MLCFISYDQRIGVTFYTSGYKIKKDGRVMTSLLYLPNTGNHTGQQLEDSAISWEKLLNVFFRTWTENTYFHPNSCSKVQLKGMLAAI